jgi:cellobiose PTS system EIIC component
MKKVMEFLEKYFVPFAGRLGSQKHLVAIRDGFATIFPLITVGALAVLVNNLPIPAYQSFMTNLFGKSWTSFGGNIWNGSFAIMSLLVALSVSYNLARAYNSNGLAAAMVTFGSLIALYSGSAKDWAIPFAYLGAQGLFVALIAALISTEIFVRLMRNPKLVIKMPDSVPPAVSRSFAALFPTMLVLVIFAAFKCLTVALGCPDIHDAVFKTIQGPLQGLSDSLPSALLVVFLVHLLWFFGLHGTNILLPITSALFLPAINDNIKAFAAQQAAPHIVTSSFFDAFVYMGGAGTSICLLIAIYMVGRRPENKMIANLGIGPGIFNINEPVLFGVPLVLNPIYVIPFILTPLIDTLIAYIAIVSGIVPRTISMMPWVTPPVIGGFLVTASFRGALLAIINIVVGVVIYLPFVLVAEKQAGKVEASKGTSAQA